MLQVPTAIKKSANIPQRFLIFFLVIGLLNEFQIYLSKADLHWVYKKSNQFSK